MGRSGFTLIETLVAMMILAISLVVILQLFSGGLKASRLSDDYTRAVFHAREKMEEILILDELIDGELEGEFEDAYKWKVEIFLHEPSEEEEEQGDPLLIAEREIRQGLLPILVRRSLPDGRYQDIPLPYLLKEAGRKHGGMLTK